MDFIKETLKQAEENQSDILAENVEGLLLNIAVQLEMSMKLMSVITNGQMLEKLGINQLKKGMSFAKDFPLSKVMLLEITEEINKNARLLREVVVSELPNGRPDITEYSVKDNRYKISDPAADVEVVALWRGAATARGHRCSGVPKRLLCDLQIRVQ